MEKSFLIDSNAEMPTRRNQEDLDRERLNEKTSYMDDAIVRSASNYTKMQKLAEMTSSSEKRVTNRTYTQLGKNTKEILYNNYTGGSYV
jgi:hypothetical protein